MDFLTAAAFPVAYVTAHLALTPRAHLGAGDMFMVHGAAGGVGHAAVDIGKRLGATVIATAGGKEHLELPAEHGADHTIEYEREDIKEQVEALTDGGWQSFRRFPALYSVGGGTIVT